MNTCICHLICRHERITTGYIITSKMLPVIVIGGNRVIEYRSVMPVR